MLHTVLGVGSAKIAAAFMVKPAAMAQRLVRAKKRIRNAGIPFVVPHAAELTERLPAVLEAVYGGYAIDWQLEPSGSPAESLSAEAVRLALTVAELLPGEPEVLALAALVCLAESRRTARWDVDGCLIPLDEQDPSRWDLPLLERGEQLLRRAHGHHRPGRFQYEAAIQSAHCSRAFGHAADPVVVRRLYRALLQVAPSMGARVAVAALDGEIDGPLAGLKAIDELAAPDFQPAVATRAHLLAAAERWEEASAAYRAAIELTPNPAVAEYLRKRLRAITI